MDRDFTVVTDLEFLKRQWLALIDRYGEHHIRSELNHTRSIRKLRERLENTEPDHDRSADWR